MADPCVRLAALIAGELPAAERDAQLAHAAACANCADRLALEAPELLLAALSASIPDPQPLDAAVFSRALPARRPLWYSPAAAAAAVLVAALLIWRARAPEGRPAPVEFAASSTAPAPEPEPDAPVVESGAEQFVVREFTAPGFDGQNAQWVVLTAESALPDEVRS